MAALIPALVLAVAPLTVASAVVAGGALLGTPGLAPSVFGGLVGPIVAAVATWIAVVRVYRRNPAGVTNVMVKAFLVKAVFFSAYVVAMIKVAALPARSFGFSFVTSFIALYALQATLFVRLFRGGLKGAR